MERNGMAGLFNVNGSVTGLTSGARQFRLPTMNPFPKLDQRGIAPADGAALAMGHLPEMISDLIDESTVYAVANVKREPNRMPGLVGRVWDAGRREARP